MSGFVFLAAVLGWALTSTVADDRAYIVAWCVLLGCYTFLRIYCEYNRRCTLGLSVGIGVCIALGWLIPRAIDPQTLHDVAVCFSSAALGGLCIGLVRKP